MDLNTFYAINFSPLVGIMFLFLFLALNARLEKSLKRLFFTLLGMELLELIVYNVELVFAAGATFSRWRILLSAIGYSIRPALLYLILCLAQRRFSSRWQRLLAALPLLANILVAFSAFWTDAAYSYTPTNEFVRGPLGFVPHFCLVFYLVLFLGGTLSQLRGRERLESIIMFAISALLVATTVIEAVWDVRSIGRTAIVQATVFYYLFFQTREYRATLDKEQREKNQFLEQTRTDPLTGLLNKTAFLQELESALNMRDERYTALVFFDLDHFKNLNDTLGHQVGDEALRDTAAAMRSVFRSEDRLGRFGGDEFCVLLRINSADALDRRLSVLRNALKKSYTRGKQTVQVTASIGAVAIAPGEKTTSEHALELADTAAYAIKRRRRDGYRVVRLK